ncbi:hypothetical protein IFU39_00200 [Paenibacillus sp. CFBP 13594]|uniref:hypothetical protein n=1 Tax=Paenibacillus sp. CFBP 13594 TaxID=2774037 RepID=UPI00177F5DBE|nr:hypothetical protein [Paenibacillus sp. CFBP 13594]MBD8836239.1 hypothetical protein [Paenibacillus sp. CFBP 13594]
MYYLRKEPEERAIPEIVKTDDTSIPERKFMSDDRAIYKHHDFSRFYRGSFKGLTEKHQGMKVYQYKTLKRIIELRESMYQYCGEYFDIYDENGKVAF